MCTHAHTCKSFCLSMVSSGVWVFIVSSGVWGFRSVGVHGELRSVSVQNYVCSGLWVSMVNSGVRMSPVSSGLWVPVFVHPSVHSFLLQFWCTVLAAWLVCSLMATIFLNNHHSLRCHGLSHPALHRSMLSSFLCLFPMAT